MKHVYTLKSTKRLKYSTVYVDKDSETLQANPVFSEESLKAARELKQSRFTFAESIEYVDSDGVPIFSIKHPSPKFNLWKWIKSIFIRPKFSEGAVEPAWEILSHGVNPEKEVTYPQK